ncbi:MAG: hypothetical protein R3B13_31410 [Polyangiaceae bacterium]
MQIEPDGLDGFAHHLQVRGGVVALADALAGLAEHPIDRVAGHLVGFEPAREAAPGRVEIDGVLAGVLGGAAGGFEIVAEELGAAGAVGFAVFVWEH